MSLVGVIVVKLTDAIARVLKGIKIRAGRGSTLERALPLLLSPRFPLLGARLLLRWIMVAGTAKSWPPQASHRVSAVAMSTISRRK